MRNKPATILMVLLLTAFATQARAAMVGDTLVIEQADRVRIETRDTVQRIVISGMKDDPYFHYTQRIAIGDTADVRRKVSNLKDFNKIAVPRKDGKPSHWGLSLHAYGGLGTMTAAPSGYSLWPSFEYGLGVTADWRPFGRHNTWSMGLMFGSKSFHVPSGNYWAKTSGLEMVPFSDDQTHTHATLHVASLQVPLLYTHRFDDRGRWAVTLGTLLNYNFLAEAERLFDFDDERYAITTRHLGQRPLTVDLLAMVKVRHLPAIYCKYAPQTFFRDHRGPKMRLLTFGVFL